METAAFKRWKAIKRGHEIQNAVARVTTKKSCCNAFTGEIFNKLQRHCQSSSPHLEVTLSLSPSLPQFFSYKKWHFETLIICKYLIGIVVLGKHIWRKRGKSLHRTKIILGRKVLKARNRFLSPWKSLHN